MADPKLDEVVFRASAAAPVDPVARLRERMLAGGIVKVAGGGGDGGPGPGPAAIPGMQIAGNQAQRGQGIQARQGAVQVPAQTLPVTSFVQGTTTGTQMLPARTIPGHGLLQPRSLAQMPGLLPKSPHPAESTQWALVHIARQDPGVNPYVKSSSVFRRKKDEETGDSWEGPQPVNEGGKPLFSEPELPFPPEHDAPPPGLPPQDFDPVSERGADVERPLRRVVLPGGSQYVKRQIIQNGKPIHALNPITLRLEQILPVLRRSTFTWRIDLPCPGPIEIRRCFSDWYLIDFHKPKNGKRFVTFSVPAADFANAFPDSQFDGDFWWCDEGVISTETMPRIEGAPWGPPDAIGSHYGVSFPWNQNIARNAKPGDPNDIRGILGHRADDILDAERVFVRHTEIDLFYCAGYLVFWAFWFATFEAVYDALGILKSTTTNGGVYREGTSNDGMPSGLERQMGSAWEVLTDTREGIIPGRQRRPK